MIYFHQVPFDGEMPGPSDDWIWNAFFAHSDKLTQCLNWLLLDIVTVEVGHECFVQEDVATAFKRGEEFAHRLLNDRPRWIILSGHHSQFRWDPKNPVPFLSFGPEAMGALETFEGGAHFITREGEIIQSGNWDRAEAWFFDTLNSRNLHPLQPSGT